MSDQSGTGADLEDSTPVEGPDPATLFSDNTPEVGEYGPTHWPALSADEATAAWEGLREWVEDLADRFCLDVRLVPPCWFRHNAMVEALSALRDYETFSFTPDAPGTAPVDWLRALREVEYHLAECAGHTQCSVNEHRDDPPRMWQIDESEWSDFVTADARRRRHGP
jgi:hypothetical protein